MWVERVATILRALVLSWLKSGAATPSAIRLVVSTATLIAVLKTAAPIVAPRTRT